MRATDGNQVDDLASDLLVVRRHRCDTIDSSSLRDLTLPYLNQQKVIVFILTT